MTPAEFLSSVIDLGTAWCVSLPGWNIPFSDEAHIMQLAIAGQEGGWEYRVQKGNGPAHSFWQMEKNGGVRGVLTHPATYRLATAVCVRAAIPARAESAWGLMASPAGDNLSVAFARLLLWTDPVPLPTTQDDGWACYARLWRPGKPRSDDWPSNYQAAVAVVKGKPSC